MKLICMVIGHRWRSSALLTLLLDATIAPANQKGIVLTGYICARCGEPGAS